MPERVLPLAQPGHLPPAPVVFDRIAVVGLGLIGGSIALAARQVWPASLIIGVDRNEVLEAAVRRGAVDVGAADLSIASEAEAVILAAPVNENVRVLAALAGALPGAAVVTDVGSTKRTIVEASRARPSRLTFVGGHPLAGSERAGIEAARPDLFVGRRWLFTPSGCDDNEALEKLCAVVSAFGAHPLVVGADEHDRLLAVPSHLPQLAAVALMDAVGALTGEQGLELAGPGLRDMTRLAASRADVWRDVCETNADNILAALDTLLDTLGRLRGALTDSRALDELFTSANTWRSKLVQPKA